MKPVDMLLAEHSLIKKALGIFSQALEQLEKGEKPSRKFFDCLLKFLNTFIEKYHSFKEDHVIFEMIAEKRTGDLIGQVKALRYHHERCGHHISEMSKSLTGYERGDEIQTTRLLENLAAYVSLLKLHLHWEDNIFYPQAKELVASAEEEKILIERFNKEDAKFTHNMMDNCRDLLTDMQSLL